jgi:hypothetical protein
LLKVVTASDFVQPRIKTARRDVAAFVALDSVPAEAVSDIILIEG